MVSRTGKQNITFSELASKYDEYARGRIRSYERSIFPIIKKHLIPSFGDVPLKEFSSQLVENFQSKLIRQNFTAATVNKYVGILKTMLSKAVDWELCTEEILRSLRKVKQLKNVNKRLRYLSIDECAKLLQCCSPHLKPIVLFAMFTGMRKGEILNLTWDQIDFKHGYILVEKTKKNERKEIPLSNSLKEVLMTLPRHPHVPYVFFNPKTLKPYTGVKRAFHTACRRAGIRDFHFHDLRHTFASQLAMSGVNIAAIKELLGHKDIKMTMCYSHLASEYKQIIMNHAEKLIFQRIMNPTVTILLTDNSQGLTEDTKNGYISMVSGD